MTTSFAQSANLTCPQCGHPFDADVWLIVDAAERPDLMERIRAGALHSLPCPRCGFAGNIDAPLLVYLPDADPAAGRPRLVFSPAHVTSIEQDRNHAEGLMGMLARSLGRAWRVSWQQELVSMPRGLLPAALSDDPAAALQALQAAMEAELAALSQSDPEAYRQLEEEALGAESDSDAGADPRAALFDVLVRFIKAESWDETQHIVEQHPELLSAETDKLLGSLIVEAAGEGDADAAESFREHRAILRRCREVGVARAFAEILLPPEVLADADAAGLTPERALAMAEEVDQILPALREVVDELNAAGVAVESIEDLDAALIARPDLRAKLDRLL